MTNAKKPTIKELKAEVSEIYLEVFEHMSENRKTCTLELREHLQYLGICPKSVDKDAFRTRLQMWLVHLAVESNAQFWVRLKAVCEQVIIHKTDECKYHLNTLGYSQQETQYFLDMYTIGNLYRKLERGLIPAADKVVF
jgi:hypothetical protein